MSRHPLAVTGQPMMPGALTPLQAAPDKTAHYTRAPGRMNESSGRAQAGIASARAN